MLSSKAVTECMRPNIRCVDGVRINPTRSALKPMLTEILRNLSSLLVDERIDPAILLGS
jgi:hypothetical protein